MEDSKQWDILCDVDVNNKFEIVMTLWAGEAAYVQRKTCDSQMRTRIRSQLELFMGLSREGIRTMRHLKCLLKAPTSGDTNSISP